MNIPLIRMIRNLVPSALRARAGTMVLLTAALLLAGACGPKNRYIRGTKITPTEENRDVIKRIETYRAAVEEKDASGILLMASKQYWEDSGTPKAEDDYGYAGLKELLRSRFKLVDSIRYSMRYMTIRYVEASEDSPRKAFVDVIIDASFTVPDARGGTRRADKRDQGQFVLEWSEEKWMFLSGM